MLQSLPIIGSQSVSTAMMAQADEINDGSFRPSRVLA